MFSLNLLLRRNLSVFSVVSGDDADSLVMIGAGRRSGFCASPPHPTWKALFLLFGDFDRNF
jgi:hypothetical protein